MKKITLCFIALISLVASTAFITDTKQERTLLLIGIAYKDVNCNGNTVSAAWGYSSGTTSSSSNYKMVETNIKAYLTNKYSIDESDVLVDYTDKLVVVVIGYEKPVQGWNCKKTVYKYGFGNNKNEAQQEALRKKNEDDPNSSWYPVTTIYK